MNLNVETNRNKESLALIDPNADNASKCSINQSNASKYL